jgi:hypothetical protein
VSVLVKRKVNDLDKLTTCCSFLVDVEVGIAS